MWERALRRARLPLAYTAGFSPRPQLSFGLALPTGCESVAEYLDVALDAHRAGPWGVAVTTLPAALTHLLPDGILVARGGRADAGSGLPPTAGDVVLVDRDVAGVTRDGLEAKVATFLEAPLGAPRQGAEGRPVEDDVRPAVLSLVVADSRPRPGPRHRPRARCAW